MEATEIELNKEIVLILIYNLPGKMVEWDLKLLMGTGNEANLAGDFNARHLTWNPIKNNADSCALIKHF